MRITLEDVAYRLLPRVATGRALAPAEWLTLVRAAEVLVDGAGAGAGAPHGLTGAEIADNVERFLTLGRSRRGWRVRVLLVLAELLPLPTYRATFSALSPEQRRRVVKELWIDGNRIGQRCTKIRHLVLVGAYGDARAARQTGYVPVPLRPRFRVVSPPPAAVAAASEAS